ncbi:hypothetical protein PMG11_04057 [Penicillium brasilianum]|uniref:CENP-V/GFA domain-containing protein n=1 Tax=Penicillium brasilianum TaxID=104259 RepID=A0A0F7VF98_PENBI|nr:hypothetical protein PMG11_04057 [Penicillium brasilianum]
MAPAYLTGTCLCKSIAYRITLPTPEPLPKIILCHCINCKRYTGSGFSVNIIVPRSSFKYTQGSPKLYLDGSDKGGVLYREFCPDCGTPFTSRSDDDEDEVAVKSGTLNDEDRERCVELGMEIYCHRKDGWVDGIGGEGVRKVNGSMDG